MSSLKPVSALVNTIAITSDGKGASTRFQTIWNQLLRYLSATTPTAVTAIADTPVTGYVEITCADGTTVKVAVVDP